MRAFIVATVKPWNVYAYRNFISKLPGSWYLVTDPDSLSIDLIKKINPDYIFFPHWSWRIPEEIFQEVPCIIFHETDVPFGRGGSPIQNLIERGYEKTVVSALKATQGLDEGPVYLQKPLSLHGTAEEIYNRAAGVIAEMIEEIISKEIEPTKQKGEALVFSRRTPGQSELPSDGESLWSVYNHIRMMDAETYPRAFIDYGNLKLVLKNPVMRTGKIEAIVEIVEKRKESDD